MMRWQVPAPLLGRLGSTPAADQQTQLLWTGLRSAFKTRSWEVSFKADDLFAFYLPPNKVFCLCTTWPLNNPSGNASHWPGAVWTLPYLSPSPGWPGHGHLLLAGSPGTADAEEDGCSSLRGFGGDEHLAPLWRHEQDAGVHVVSGWCLTPSRTPCGVGQKTLKIPLYCSLPCCVLRTF